MTPSKMRSDLDRATDAIASVTGEQPIGFRAPDFSVGRSTLWALDVLAEYGFRYDSSIYPVDFMRYGISDFPPGPTQIRTQSGSTIDEMPITAWRVAGKNLGAGGGAYLRLLPSGLTRRALRQAERNDRSGCVYFHPWELDPDQPRQEVGRRTNYRQLHNTRRMADRVGALLEEFEFAPISTCLDLETTRADRPTVEVDSLLSRGSGNAMPGG